MVTAILPLRKGSKGIPGKNTKMIAGKPLYQWQLDALVASPAIHTVIVASDDEELLLSLLGYDSDKVITYRRSDESAMDQSSTEEVMIEVINNYEIESDIIVLAQATNPFPVARDYTVAVNFFQESYPQYNSLLSAVRFEGFTWTETPSVSNTFIPDYSITNRPRRQDKQEKRYIENGAMYISYGSDILAQECRLTSNAVIYEMPQYSLHEIDTYDDWLIVEALLLSDLHSYDRSAWTREEKKEEVETLFPVSDSSDIRLIVTDVDGILTNNRISIAGETGPISKEFNLIDQAGIRKLQKKGIEVVALTADSRGAPVSRAFLEPLGVTVFLSHSTEKLEKLKEILYSRSLLTNQVAYIGDRESDADCMILDGILSVCPKDAQNLIKDRSVYTLERSGGEGIFEELTEPGGIFGEGK